jgi:hypothetical protein
MVPDKVAIAIIASLLCLQNLLLWIVVMLNHKRTIDYENRLARKINDTIDYLILVDDAITKLDIAVTCVEKGKANG